MGEYVIVLDKDRDHCRLFRSDCPDTPAGEVLWSGDGLRRGYDEMIRQNLNRRPLKSYVVCSREGARGRKAYRLFSSSPGEGWTVLSVHHSWKEARDETARLVRERAAAEQAEKDRLAGLLERVGMPSRRTPRFTDKDVRYIEWLRLTGRFEGELPAAASPRVEEAA